MAQGLTMPMNCMDSGLEYLNFAQFCGDLFLVQLYQFFVDWCDLFDHEQNFVVITYLIFGWEQNIFIKSKFAMENLKWNGLVVFILPI